MVPQAVLGSLCTSSRTKRLHSARLPSSIPTLCCNSHQVPSYSEERKIACKVRDELFQLADSPYLQAPAAANGNNAQDNRASAPALGTAAARAEGPTSTSSTALMRLDAVTPSSQAEAARKAREVQLLPNAVLPLCMPGEHLSLLDSSRLGTCQEYISSAHPWQSHSCVRSEVKWYSNRQSSCARKFALDIYMDRFRQEA
jgi:hypothetical protein